MIVIVLVFAGINCPMIGVAAVLKIKHRSIINPMIVVVLVFATIMCPMIGVAAVLRINCRSIVQ